MTIGTYLLRAHSAKTQQRERGRLGRGILQVQEPPKPEGPVPAPYPVFDHLRWRALDLAAEISELPFAEVVELRAGVRERLSRGTDLEDLPLRLRPLMNRVLDIVDVSSLPRSQARRLEQTIFTSPGAKHAA